MAEGPKDNKFLMAAAKLCAGQDVDDVAILAISLLMASIHQRGGGNKEHALAMLDLSHRMMRKCMDEEFERVEATGESYECRCLH